MNGKRKRVLVVIAVLAAVQVLAIVLYRRLDGAGDESRVQSFTFERLGGEPAPDLELVAADGTISRLSDRRGKTVLVHFWATWCPPCRHELPDLLALADELAGEGGFELVAVSSDPDWAAVRTFLGRATTRWVHLDGGRGHRGYRVTTLPDSYVVGPDGRTLYRVAGERNWRSREAREFLRAAVRREGS